jgi:hypothetical protein
MAVKPLEAPLHEPLEAHSASFAEAASGVSSQTILSIPVSTAQCRIFFSTVVPFWKFFFNYGGLDSVF